MSQSSNFWLLLHAVHAFTQHPSNPSHLLPLSGALPDMKATSSSYVTLQKLYKQKARDDLDLVKSLLNETLASAGLEQGSSTVKEEEVESFVKHAAWLKVIRGRSLRQEMGDECKLKGQIGEYGRIPASSEEEAPLANAQFNASYHNPGSVLASSSFQEPPDISLHIYTALRAADEFRSAHARFPGAASPEAPNTDVDLEKDADELTRMAEALIAGWKGEEDLASVGVDEEAFKSTLANACKEV